MSLNKIERRERIKMRIRKIVSGTPAQPRMTVFRSNKQIYVQFIDDLAGVTLSTETATCITEELNSWPKQHAKADLNSKRSCQIPT